MANKITVTSAGTVVNANVTPDSAMYYSNKSKEWAISNKIVDNTDYSSKYYANESKKQADISTAKATEVIESGNTAVSNIESARDNAIIDITNQESLSVDNVNTAGATQIANVNSAGTTQINLAKEQVTLATEQATIATEQATIATNKTTEVVTSGNTALSNIDTAKNNAITSITNQETTSRNVLIDEGATQVGLIQNEGATQVDTIKKTGFYVQDGDLYCLDAEGKPKKLDTISDYSINNVHSFGDSKYVPTPVNNLSWLKSEGQQNPKGSYPDVYNWILENVNNGVEGFKRSTETYTDYDYVINTTDETFRLPLLNGSESLPSGKTQNLGTIPTEKPYIPKENGFIFISGMASSAGKYVSVYLKGNSYGNKVIAGSSGQPVFGTVEVRKGLEYIIDYTATLTTLIFISAQGNGSLYFYVGETVQNANLIDAGRIGEQLVNVKASIDGDWTYKHLSLASSVSIPINTEGVGGVFTYDLSNYLPNDGYKYEVTISVEVNNSNFCTLGYFLPDNSWYSFAKGGNPSGGCFTAIVDSSRQVKISIVNLQEALMWARAAAYRRLGKKV